jgi:hypothetical protein
MEEGMNGVKEYYIHYVPDRIRIQTPILHENPDNAEQFERFMKVIKGITAVETHPSLDVVILTWRERLKKKLISTNPNGKGGMICQKQF